MNALRCRLADARPFGCLRAAAAADLEILPFQLEPVLAVVRGLASRVLIADEVGLGKTIQAGLVLAELRDRGWADRVLILTPAGLREQWAEELAHRFAIRAAVMDAGSVRDRVSALPAGLNPWAIQSVSIASLDFIKRPEVLQALDSIIWDVLIIDEAHLAAAAPQRGAAVRTLARRSRHVVLLTATPHDGNDESFALLCDIGRLGTEDRMVMFRRTRQDVGISLGRRTHLLPVRLDERELLMQRLIREYANRLWSADQPAPHAAASRLVAMVLLKRALSSAASLARSIERRLEAFDGQLDDSAFQTGLPFGFEQAAEQDDDAPVLGWPALADRDDERACLERILEAARHAACSERKLETLQRLLRRVSEPALVFTEYRDTLDTVAAALQGIRRWTLLHGGMDAYQRRAALDSFRSGTANLLLATDAGCEGLNLQSCCRLVINLELPWNPMRLEQRIGRVDRIGQRRTVHAIHLFARDTAENWVLSRLYRRLERIRRRLGPLTDPLPAPNDAAIAEAMIAGTDPATAETSFPDFQHSADLQAASRREATRLLRVRALSRFPAVSASRRPRGPLKPAPTTKPPELDGLLATVIRPRSRLQLPAGPSCAIWVMRARIADAGGRLLEPLLLAVHAALPASMMNGDLRRARDVKQIGEQLLSRGGAAILSVAQEHARRRVAEIASESGPARLLAQEREIAIAKSFQRDGLSLVQAGLFDARAIRNGAQVRVLRQQAQAEVDARTAKLEAASNIRLAGSAEPILLLFIRAG